MEAIYNPGVVIPFAITAKCSGMPEKLYTKILVANRIIDNSEMRAKYVNALWDTGAVRSSLTPDLADELGIKYEGHIYASGIGGKVKGSLGVARIALVSNGGLVETIAGIVPRSRKTKYSFVIGMDIISKGSLAITTTFEGTVLSFYAPAEMPIDFTKILDDSKYKKEILPLSSGYEWDYNKIYKGEEVIRLIKPKRD